jgi:hypothetical protein
MTAAHAQSHDPVRRARVRRTVAALVVAAVGAYALFFVLAMRP